jgi:hypothetical protein
MIIHLVGVTEEEAQASLDEHGEVETCSWKKCSEPTETMLIVKKPGNDWGQNIGSMGACATHRQELETLVKKITTPSASPEATKGCKPKTKGTEN